MCGIQKLLEESTGFGVQKPWCPVLPMKQYKEPSVLISHLSMRDLASTFLLRSGRIRRDKGDEGNGLRWPRVGVLGELRAKSRWSQPMGLKL